MTKKQISEIQQLVKKRGARHETGLFVAEGERLVSEVPESLILKRIASESYASSHELSGKIEVVPDSVFAKLSDTKTPQGILAIVKKPTFSRDECLAAPAGLYLILETIQDPGNLGTIFRSAEGAGVTAIFLNRETADLYAPKAVRSTMGSVFRVPHFFTETVEDAAALLTPRKVTLYAADLAGATRYDEADYRSDTAFLIGNEGNGLTEAVLSLADTRIRIPMGGHLESLNAGVATSLLVYEVARQRGFGV